MSEIKYMNEEEFLQIIEPMEEMSRLLRRYSSIKKSFDVTLKQFEDLTFTDEQGLIVDYVNKKMEKYLKESR